jgi:hypothetical protein
VDDALAKKIQEGVRYQASLRVKEQIRAGIIAKRAATKEEKIWTIKKKPTNYRCAAEFSLLNLPKGKRLGRSKPATNS